MRERWHNRSAQGPVALMIQVASTRSSLPAQLIAQQHAGHAPMADIHGQHLRMIAGHGAGFHRLDQPLRHQALGEFTLGVFVAEHRPAPAGVEQALQLLLLLYGSILPASLPPPRRRYSHRPVRMVRRAAPAVLVERQQEIYGMHQVRALLQQAPAFD